MAVRWNRNVPICIGFFTSGDFFNGLLTSVDNMDLLVFRFLRAVRRRYHGLAGLAGSSR